MVYNEFDCPKNDRDYEQIGNERNLKLTDILLNNSLTNKTPDKTPPKAGQKDKKGK